MRTPHRCRRKTFEDFSRARDHDSESQSPQPAAHQVHSNQTGHEKVDITSARFRNLSRSPTFATSALPLPLCKTSSTRSLAVRLSGLVGSKRYSKESFAGLTTIDTFPLRNACAASSGLNTVARDFRRARQHVGSLSLLSSASASIATGVLSAPCCEKRCRAQTSSTRER